MRSLFGSGRFPDDGARRMADIEAAQAALAAEVESLSIRTARGVDKAERRKTRVAATIAALEHRIEDQARMMEELAIAIRSLEEAAGHRERRLAQIGADLLRIERQAAIDLAESRRSSAALAELLLKRRPGAHEPARASDGCIA